MVQEPISVTVELDYPEVSTVSEEDVTHDIGRYTCNVYGAFDPNYNDDRDTIELHVGEDSATDDVTPRW